MLKKEKNSGVNDLSNEVGIYNTGKMKRANEDSV